MTARLRLVWMLPGIAMLVAAWSLYRTPLMQLSFSLALLCQ